MIFFTNKARKKIAQNKKGEGGMQFVFQLREFRKLWIAQIFSQLADKFYIVLMVYLIAEFFVSSDTQNIKEITEIFPKSFNSNEQQITFLATGIYIANTIPAIFLGTIAGVGADLWPKRQIMEISNILKSLLTILIPICLIPGPDFLGIKWGYFFILGITILVSSFTQFFTPAEQATIPLVVPTKTLLPANSIYQATSMGSLIIGFAIGEPLLNLSKQLFLSFGIQGGEFILIPCFYAAAAITIKAIDLNENKRRTPPESFWNEIIEGFEVIKQKPPIRKAIIQIVFLYSLLASLYVITITLSSSIQSLGPTRFGSLLAITGAGIALGAIWLAQKGAILNFKQISSTGLWIITISLFLLSKAKGSLSLTLLLCFLLGLGIALIVIPAQTTIHRETLSRERGKVFGVQNNLINIAIALPLVLTGSLISLMGLNAVLWVIAGVVLLAAFLEKLSSTAKLK